MLELCSHGSNGNHRSTVTRACVCVFMWFFTFTFHWPSCFFVFFLQRSSLSTAWTTRLLSSWWPDLVTWLTRTRPSSQERGTPWGSPWPWWDICSWMLRLASASLTSLKIKSNSSRIFLQRKYKQCSQCLRIGTEVHFFIHSSKTVSHRQPTNFDLLSLFWWGTTATELFRFVFSYCLVTKWGFYIIQS